METDPNFLSALRRIRLRADLRYLDVKPYGMDVDGRCGYVRTAIAYIYDFGSARTLYQQRVPTCRSLDGVTSITREPKQECVTCNQRFACTPQTRLDLLIGSNAFRCLLAYTSARNFLFYESNLRREGLAIDRVDTELTIVDRGSWGEVRFRRADLAHNEPSTGNS
jgi:hypothetical protein